MAELYFAETIKDPNATLDYTFEWADELRAPATLASATCLVSPNDGSLALVQQANNSTAHTVRLTGGKRGKQYRVTSRMTDTAGRSDDRTLLVTIEER